MNKSGKKPEHNLNRKSYTEPSGKKRTSKVKVPSVDPFRAQMPEEQAVGQVKGGERWLPGSLKPYIQSTDAARDILTRFEMFSEYAGVPDDLIYWIATALPLRHANLVLTQEGCKQVQAMFPAIPAKEWALCHPEWWETYKIWRKRTLADFYQYEPPRVPPAMIPVEALAWWRDNVITDPQESDPRRRIGYLLAADLLPTPISEVGLVHFVADQIEDPDPDTTHVTWGLSRQGFEQLRTTKKARVRGSKGNRHRLGCKRTDTPVDKDIYRRHKFSHESYADLGKYFDMAPKDVERIYWKMVKRETRKK